MPLPYKVKGETCQAHCAEVHRTCMSFMHVIRSSIIVSMCVCVPSSRKAKGVYEVYHHTFSFIRRVCVEYPSYILSANFVSKAGEQTQPGKQICKETGFKKLRLD